MEKIIGFAKTISLSYSPSKNPYDLFYFMWVVIMLALCALAIFLSLKDAEKTLKVCYIVSAAIMWTGELYKQFIYTFAKDAPSYNWYFFPFQFCSMPLYTYLLAVIIKKGKIYDALSAFNGTYCLLAGLLVMAFPSSVSSSLLGISIQSMLHHVLMVVTGAVALRTYAKKFDLTLFLYSLAVFAITVSVAEILNFLLPAVTGQKVNMFFIGPYIKLPIFAPFIDAFPYPVFVILYVLVFSELAAGISLAAKRLSNLKIRRHYFK